MVVPNYVPDPVEIPGNVTEKPYPVRLSFVRRVMALHLATVAGVATVAHLSSGSNLWFSAGVVGASLLLLCAIRVALRGSPMEWMASGAVLPALLASLGTMLGALHALSVPVWAPAVGLGFAFVYGMICGRDFSFVGQWFLSLLLSSLALAALVGMLSMPVSAGSIAILLNACYLTFYVYDLASLLSRRRLGEEIGAVADLYRDVLNFGGYFVRVLQHWRKHRIWAIR